MRFGDERESSNFEDVTGRSGMGFGGGGGGTRSAACCRWSPAASGSAA